MRGHDLTGKRFTRLVVKERTARRMNGSVCWRCICDCGVVKIIGAAELRYGKTKSCGCLHREAASRLGRRIGGLNRKHGHKAGTSESPTYGTWRAMRKRCADSGRKYYGGLGVTVCERWEKFDNFLADMGERPPGKTLDRYPNPAGNYEPSNCRWATWREQRLNRRRKAA